VVNRLESGDAGRKGLGDSRLSGGSSASCRHKGSSIATASYRGRWGMVGRLADVTLAAS